MTAGTQSTKVPTNANHTSEGTDGDNNSRFGDDEYGGGGGRGGPLSPVSEDPGEYMDDEEVMMYEMIEAGVPPPPDGGWGWVIVFASFMCNLIVDGIAYTFGVFLDSFAESFYANPEEGIGNVAWAGSLLCGVYLCVGPVVSALTNKFGCRIVCISGAIIGSIGFALSSLSPNLEVLILTYGVIGGIGFGLIYLPAVVCVGYYFEKKRALATGIAVCGSGVGTFVFAPLARFFLSQGLGWKGANIIFAGLIFSCAIFGAMMRPLEIKREPLQEDDGDEEDSDEKVSKNKPLLQRMAEDKRNQMEKGSLAGSAYFMVQLPDGTMEKRMKMPINIDPGVHSSFNLDQLVPGTPITPNPTLPTITEGKTKDGSGGSPSDSSQEGSAAELKSPTESDGSKEKENVSKGTDDSRTIMSTTPAIPIPIPEPIAEEKEPDGSFDSVDETQLSSSAMTSHRRHMRERRNSDGIYSISPPSVKQSDSLLGKSPPRVVPVIGRSGSVATPFTNRIPGMPRNGSAPNFTPGRSIPKNGSVPFFDRMPRKHSYRAVPAGSFQRPTSRTNLNENRRSSGGTSNHLNAKNNNSGNGNPDDDYSSMWSRGELNEGLIFSTSHRGSSSTQATTEPRHIIRPLSRKDIFYSGSIVNLPEFQSQKSINSYRQSVLNLPRVGSVSWKQGGGDEGDFSPLKKQKPGICPCWSGGAAGSFKTALAQLMDFSLLKNPVFLFIAASNVFGMLGFYVPFVYIIKSAESKKVEGDAAFLLSIIGITNTLGRILCGLISDLPQVNSLFMSNMCVTLAGICVAAIPLCPGYYSYVAVAIFFGLFVAGYVSLTSIILVDLLGLDNLTNAFGLLILFRGAASIVGAPLAGAVRVAFDSFEIPFYLAGSFLIVAGIISFMIPCVAKFAPEKKILQPHLMGGGYLEDIPEAAESCSPNDSTDLEKGKDNPEQIESCV